MSRILLIRHGQASFLKKNYDQLSELGHQQAIQLGIFFKSQGISIDLAYTGQLRRQKETAAGCLKQLGRSVQIIEDMGYDEHEGPSVVRAYYPEKFHMNKDLDPALFETYRREFYGSYFKLAIPWVKNQLDSDKIKNIESWSSFKIRFSKAFQKTMDNCHSGSTVAIFTSGGPVGASVGHALDLDDQKTIALGWQVKNSSFTEFLYSKGKISLVSFNETPHLSEKKLQTLV